MDPRMRLHRWITGLDTWGATLGALALLVSFSPSLLPRTWPLHGLAAGLSGVLVYGLTVAARSLLRRIADLTGMAVHVTGPDRRARRAGGVVLVAAFLAFWVWALQGQAETAALVGMEGPTWWRSVLALLLALAVAAGGLALARGVRRLVRRVAARLPDRVPRRLGLGLSAAVVVLAVVWTTNTLLVSTVSQALGQRFYEANDQAPEGVVAPTDPGRSGSPGSGQTWQSLGREGRVFVTGGPDAARITEVTGQEAMEPIRVYAGLGPSDGFEEAADAVVEELHRTGAFERSVIVVYTTTGTGWVNEWAAQSVEYLMAGDSAVASMQYSYLPSPLSLIADRVRPPQAGRALFERVWAEVQTLPEDDRPRVMVGGESLGSYGGHGAFRDADDMVARTDGGVWVGTPAFTPLWRSITDGRQQGSPEVAPVVDNGRHLRFVTRPQDLQADIYGRPLGEWEEPRIAYLQHASDPISRWDGDLVLSRPDWLREKAGTDVNPDMEWFPLVTFWQVTTDQALGNATEPGHGHLYHEDLVLAWAEVLGAPGDLDLDAIAAAIRDR